MMEDMRSGTGGTGARRPGGAIPPRSDRRDRAAGGGAWRGIGPLTPTERRICAAFPFGVEVDLRSGDPAFDDPANADAWPAERTVRAEVLSALLLGAGARIPGRIEALRLRGALITGSLLLSHGRIDASWLLERCRIDGHIDIEGTETSSVYLRGTHMRTLSAYHARIRGVLALSHAVIAGTQELALYADAVTIDGDLRGRQLRVTGPVSLVGANIHGQVSLGGARIVNPGGNSLHAGGMHVGRSLICTGLVSVGEVRLPGASIGSGLVFDGAWLYGGGRHALSATSMTVEGDASFRREFPGGGRHFKALGSVALPGSQVGGNLYFSGARFYGRGSAALHARRISVAGGVKLDKGLRTADELRFTGAKIGGDLDLTGMKSPDALLTLYGAHVAGGVRDATVLDERGRPCDPCVDWPNRVNLDGLTYGQFDPYRPVRQRLQLLKRQVKTDGQEAGGYRAQPYEQLAAHYRALGNDGEARWALLAKARAGRANRPWYRRIAGYFLDGLVGYGYRPTRAIAWALGLLVGASVYYSTVTPMRVDDQDTSVFNPVLYTADQLIPVVRFGQPEVWQFHGAAAVVGVVLTVLGWTLGIAIASGATRVLTRN